MLLKIIYITGVFLLISCASTADEKIPKSDHYNSEKDVFFNPHAKEDHGFFEFLKWIFNRNQGAWPEKVPLKSKPNLPQKLESNQMAITFVNHATFLIQIPGLNILTDPIWSDRASPVSFAGPKRVISPGIKISQLPRIDVIIISHNHYDHMDLETLKKLNDKYHPKILVPLRNKRFLQSKGLENIEELDWWDNIDLNKNEITLVPAQHFSSRSLFDRNKTLWGGFVIKHKDLKIFFAGDTGYSPHFKEIAQRFGGVQLSLLPIGAYKPRWFMGPVHIDPYEAVKAHLDLKSQQSIGMHYGCFKLADDSFKSPVEDLIKAKQKFKIKDNSFRTMNEGQTLYYQFSKNQLQEITYE